MALGGDLHYHLSQHGVFSEKEMRFYATEIILGLEHMHSRSVVYRDLKVTPARRGRGGEAGHQGLCRKAAVTSLVSPKRALPGHPSLRPKTEVGRRWPDCVGSGGCDGVFTAPVCPGALVGSKGCKALGL